jgi:hypothetical protein
VTPLAFTLVALLFSVSIGPAAAADRGFFDVYGGALHMLESDVPDWRFEASSTTAGARVGIHLAPSWALTFRSWYFDSDAKQRGTSPSDLGFLGLSFELLAKWRLDDRWALYATLGPMVAITTLDLEERIGDLKREQDAHSVSPGASAGIGLDAHVYGPLRAFAESHFTFVKPGFSFPGRDISPELLTLYGLLGVRVGF